MEVISIQSKEQAKRKANLLEVLDDLRASVEAGHIDEFVAASIGADGQVEIHACVKDTVGGVGLFEIGKHIFIQQTASE
jgi:hypothetical protein